MNSEGLLNFFPSFPLSLIPVSWSSPEGGQQFRCSGARGEGTGHLDLMAKAKQPKSPKPPKTSWNCAETTFFQSYMLCRFVDQSFTFQASFEDMWDFQISTVCTLGWNSLLSFFSNVAIDSSLKLSGFGDGIKGSTLCKQSDSVQFSGEFNFLPSSSPLPFTWLKLAQSPPSLL